VQRVGQIRRERGLDAPAPAAAASWP
jgi:hypothetical protein